MLLVWILAPKKWIIILIVLAEFCFLGTEAVEQEEIQYFLFFLGTGTTLNTILKLALYY